MFGFKTKNQKLQDQIKNDVENVSELEYFIMIIGEDIEQIIIDNKLQLRFEKTVVTVNAVKFYFDLYKKTTASGFEITNVKKVESFEKDFKRINDKIQISTDEKMIVFTIPRIEREIVDYNVLYEKITRDELMNEYKLPIIAGVNEKSEIIVGDLVDEPHIGVFGVTGSGKSVFINNLICTWLTYKKPNELQLAMIDPKGGVEFAPYGVLKNYLFDDIKVKTQESIELIYKIHEEMETRYELLNSKGVRNIQSLHEKNIELPYLVVIIDEFANVATSFRSKKEKNEFDDIITSLLQMSRACGIHLVIGTQRPTVDVITGSIKVNLPTRYCFHITTGVDSKTAIDQAGAENLLGNGDGYIYRNGNLTRFQSAFIMDDEIQNVICHAMKVQEWFENFEEDEEIEIEEKEEIEV